MTVIALVGDSWGVPNYYGPPGVAPEYHTEFILRKVGYDVVNFSINGGSNYKSLSDLHFHILQGNIVDWIIWFHTDMIKDQKLVNLSKPFNTKDLIIEISEKVYNKWNQVVSDSQAKTIVIGASAELLDNFDQFVNPDYRIQDWRSDIVGRKLPLAYAHHYLEILEHKNNKDTIEDKLAIVDAKTAIVEAMSNTELFPDRSHPGIDPHKKLSEFIDQCIKNI
jgi:hypothetical protein